MKFARLYLKAYGPFRDRVIELPSAAGKDFHVLFGPNEAGKSTILRAVTGFLFGIPERTPDAFLSDYGALRVGATLLMADASRLSAMRRKARKATLFAIDERSGAETTDRPLPEKSITDLLGGLDQALYKNLFGLDLSGLVAGSDELLRGEGELGRSLFQAAAGLASLHGLMAGLDNEASALFKPRGLTGRLNRALSDFDEQRHVLKETTVRSTEWESAERAYRQANSQLLQLREALKNERSEQQRLERIRANLPLVAEHAVKQVELAQLGAVAALTPDAAARRIAAQERLRGASEAKSGARDRLLRLQSELEGVVVRERLLDNASAIERMFHALGEYRSAREALPRTIAARAELAGKLHRQLVEIDPACALDRAEALLPRETLAARVQSMIEEHARLTGLDEQLDGQVRAKNGALEGLVARLASLSPPVPVEELEASLAAVANAPDLDARQRRLVRDIADLESALQRDAAALGAGSVSQLVDLAVPLPATAADIEDAFAVLIQDERLVADKAQGLMRDVEERGRELNALTATGEVVTWTEVAAARKDRDDKWSRLRGVVVERITETARPFGNGKAGAFLAADFEQAIREADRLADLLHADAQRAANLETTRQRIADMQAESQRNEDERARVESRRRDLEQRWEALAAPLGCRHLTPGALRDWLSRRQRVVDRHHDLEQLRRDRDGVADDLSNARAAMERALIRCGLGALAGDETAAGALARAQQALGAARKLRADRDAIEQQIESARTELRDVQDRRRQLKDKAAAWRSNWHAAAESLKLSADALPAEAKIRIDQLARLAAGLGELGKLDAESNDHRTLVAGFESGIADLASAVEEAAVDDNAGAIAERLYAALGEARSAAAKRQQLAGEIVREERTHAEAETAAQQAGRQLDELVRQAGCATADDLPEIETRAQRTQILRLRLGEIEEQLVRHNARPIEEVVRETAGFDLDTLARQTSDLADEIAELERQVEGAQGADFRAKQELDAIDGGPAAAEARQNLSALCARIAKDARAYARARLAAAVLNRVIQVYQDRHQGPLLRRAAQLFERITLGSFAGLTADYQDDRQVLLGVRPSDERVAVAGMSQGTRDQLFLSLRLAAIEQHLDGREPMPVIIDDLLVQFDDDRALATMQVLAELSRKTQVLFFTHHRHLVNLARNSSAGSAITVHDLLQCASAT